MTQIRVTHTLDDLEDDMKRLPKKAAVEAAKVVRANAKLGNRLAKANAKRSAGRHGKHYPNSFTAEALGAATWEYGPDASKPQGNMSFEYGSRNQPPHLDLTRSADAVKPVFHRDVKDMLDRLFW